MLLVPCADTGNADEQHRGDLAVHEVAVVVYRPPLDTSVDVAQDTAPVVEHSRVYRILEELQQHGYINRCAEYLVEPL